MKQITVLDKQQELTKLADSDEAYLVWKNCFLSFAEDFARFADSQPEYARKVLWGYAESGRMMYQRLVNLACEHMEFEEK